MSTTIAVMLWYGCCQWRGSGAVLVRCVHGTYVCRAPFLCAWSSKGKLILNLKTNIQVVTNMFTKCNLKLLFQMIRH